MKCSKCGKEIKTVHMNMFDSYGGGDSFVEHDFEEHEKDAIVIDTTKNFVGYELDEEEMVNCIECPHCKKYPFDEKSGVQMYEFIRVVLFKKDGEFEV